VREIARDAGLTAMMVHRYFGSKSSCSLRRLRLVMRIIERFNALLLV
jgi:AcrR family transcriptional regulator